MLAVIGTVPEEDFPLIHGPVHICDGHLDLSGHRIPINRGTPALLGAAVKAAAALDNHPEIYAFLVGDIGRGDGSRRLYDFLTRHLSEFSFKVMTFHYLQPDVDWHNKILFAVDELKSRPLLIADAGFMYAAKISGLAAAYDLFTPDAGELAFLADETAPHPFYTRGFILHEDNQTPGLIQRAYQHQNSARHLLVKGKVDYITCEDRLVETIRHPSAESMEAIGGTGDTLTGLVSVLCEAGFQITEAATLGARANRWCGHYAAPTPATQIIDLINIIPLALSRVLKEYQK